MSQIQDLEILTPEHVRIRLSPAGLGNRFVALLVDLVLTISISVCLNGLLGIVLPSAVSGGLGLTIYFVISWGYHLYFETRRQGRSPGKTIMKLRVVDGRGLPITLQQSFVRNIVRVLDSAPLMYALGGLSCMLDRHNRRLGDIAADTLVVKETQPADYSAQLAQARHFNSLRTARVRRMIKHRIGLAEREFLLKLCLRSGAINDKARYDLMEEVGNYYRKKLEIDDSHLSGENLVRDLTSLLFDKGA